MTMRAADKRPVAVQEGMLRSVLGHGERIMMIEVSIERGSVAALHAHPHEQVTYVVRGTVQFTLGDKKIVLSAGDSCFVAPDISHGAEALSDCLLVDAFSPPRQDFLES